MSNESKSKLNIALFAFNNAATNCYMILLNIASYYTFGKAGMIMSILLNIITVMRILDGITDPFIGTLIDKTETRFGKYRPFMLIGQLTMLGSVLILYTLVNKISIKPLAYLAFIFVYAVYVLGYTCQTATTKAGQTILTHNPKIRPLMALFDTIYSTIIFTSFGVILPLLAKRYGDLANQNVFNMMMLIYMPLSLLFTVLAVIGIKDHDNSIYFLKNKEKIKFSDFIGVLRHNKPLRLLIFSAASDKLAQTVSGHTLLTTLLFSVILNNYTLSSYLSIGVSIATILVIFLTTKIASSKGQRKAFVFSSAFALASALFLTIVMLIINPKGARLSALSFKGIIFSISFILMRAGMTLAQGMVIPMIADCSDYEAYKYNKSIPGLIGTLFSFVDKLVSSLGTSILSIMLLFAIGNESLDVTTSYQASLFVVFLIGGELFPIVGFIINLILMRNYELTKNKMLEISQALKKRLEEKN